MEAVFESSDHIRLCGRLTDKFGDNGIVSVVVGKLEGEILDIELWLMSCRVLKREMEYAMLDTLVGEAARKGVKVIRGHYYPTLKNKMVKELFGDFGFDKINEDKDGNTLWELKTNDYCNKNTHIAINP